MGAMSASPKLAHLVLATRPSFLTIAAVGCLIGFALSYQQTGGIDPWACLLAIMVAVIGQASANVINDYYDALNGSDAINQDRISPFTGGSRRIQDALLSETQVKAIGVTTLLLATLAGTALLHRLNAWHLIWVGCAGLFIGWAYSAEPFRLMSRGLWGEAAIVAAWALIVAGSASLQTHQLTPSAIMLGIAYGLPVASILYANQIPDIKADRAVGKMTLAVRTPAHQLWIWYALFAALSWAIVMGMIAVHTLPNAALLSLIGLPFSLAAIHNLKKAPLPRQTITSCIKQTILAAHLFGLGLSVGIAIG